MFYQILLEITTSYQGLKNKQGRLILVLLSVDMFKFICLFTKPKNKYSRKMSRNLLIIELIKYLEFELHLMKIIMWEQVFFFHYFF